MAARKKVKPEPRVIQTICSICGEDWGLHDEVDGEVSTLECVRLLKAKIARTPVFTPTVIKPYTCPYWWTPTVWCSTGSGNAVTSTGSFTVTSAATINTNTPTIATANAA